MASGAYKRRGSTQGLSQCILHFHAFTATLSGSLEKKVTQIKLVVPYRKQKQSVTNIPTSRTSNLRLRPERGAEMQREFV